ncbi:MAG: N-acetyltransferase [Pacificimonas sp.]|jgi:putative acetyltransferase|nr:N-acetyltransferase [Pacificimonas sp.]
MFFAIREERPGDELAIYDLTKRAFASMPFSDGDEQDLINRLRAVEALTLSLVAQKAERIVGHVAFTPADADDGAVGWFALGPVSAEPDLQGQGIGGALIREGLTRLRADGAAGCILIGDPEYYQRFGFLKRPDLCPAGEPAAYFQLLELNGPAPQGRLHFHPLFAG